MIWYIFYYYTILMSRKSRDEVENFTKSSTRLYFLQGRDISLWYISKIELSRNFKSWLDSTNSLNSEKKKHHELLFYQCISFSLFVAQQLNIYRYRRIMSFDVVNFWFWFYFYLVLFDKFKFKIDENKNSFNKIQIRCIFKMIKRFSWLNVEL